MPKIDAKLTPSWGRARDLGGFVCGLLMDSFLVGPGDLFCGVVPGLAMIGPRCGVRSSMMSFSRQRGEGLYINGEFDPGSGRTLAACLTHASRTVRPLWGYTSGERVSNT